MASSSASAGEAGDDDVEDRGDTVNDGTEYVGYASDDSCEAVSDGAEHRLNLIEHCGLAIQARIRGRIDVCIRIAGESQRSKGRVEAKNVRKRRRHP